MLAPRGAGSTPQRRGAHGQRGRRGAGRAAPVQRGVLGRLAQRLRLGAAGLGLRGRVLGQPAQLVGLAAQRGQRARRARQARLRLGRVRLGQRRLSAAAPVGAPAQSSQAARRCDTGSARG